MNGDLVNYYSLEINENFPNFFRKEAHFSIHPRASVMTKQISLFIVFRTFINMR